MRRPNTSGQRGGAPSRRPLPLAEPTYNANDEQAFRRQLDQQLVALQNQIDFLSSIARIGLLAVSATGVDFNAGAADTEVAVYLPAGASRFRVQSASVSGASGSLTTATVGIFTAAGGGGETIAADQAITVSTAAEDTNNNCMALALTHANTESYDVDTLYVRVGTPEGAAATGDVTVYLYAAP
jgi:hypothetical protein